MEQKRGDDGATSQRHRKMRCATFRIHGAPITRADDGAMSYRQRGDFAAYVPWPIRAIPNVAQTFLRCRCEVAPSSARCRSVIGAP